MMKYLQKIGKSLMLPVACLPAAGILYGIGYWIDPTGWGANSIVAAFMIKAASAIIDQIPLLFAIGLVFGVAYYFIFKFCILHFNLKTPGREDDDDEAGEMKIELANNDFTAMAERILEGLGGKENITEADYCATRIRCEIKSYEAVNEKKIKSSGVPGVIRPSKTTVQVVVGPKVQFVYEEMKKMMK